ncbi:MAG: N-acetyltransferase [Bacteroidetes bacterium]|nr:MAG: N-acetyltransferase [Bacteroidota bacterium]
MDFELETDRFYLRKFLEEDATDLFELDSDPEVHRFLGNNPVTSIEQCQKVIQMVQKQYEDFGIGRWAVIDKETGEHLGWSGLKYERELRDFPYYDLGYRLKRKHWGKGIATETAKAALRYGFETMGLEKIHAAADVEHQVSNHVLQKVGMKWVEQFDYDGPCNWYELRSSKY